MAELFIELFSEEIPAQLQIDARQKISQSIGEKLNKKEISFKSNNFFSTPNRLVIVIDGIPEKIEQNTKIIKGPKVDAPQIALQGFIKSNNLNKSDIYKKVINKGEFYFASTKSKVINVLNELQSIIPESLQNYSWKKSMKWSTYELNWGRPLKSIAAVFDNTLVNFNFFHLHSSDLIYINKIDGDKGKKVNDFTSYQNLLKKKNIILDQEKRKNLIKKKN